VALEIVVDETGSVSELEVLREEPERKGFADHAVAAVKRWRYRAVEVDGAPVPVRLPVYVTIPPPAKTP
jgi:TonB family protein